MAPDMSESCEFPSLDICQKRFLWTHKEVDLAPYPVVGLVLQVGHVEKFPQALGCESLDPVLRVSEQGPYLKAIEEDEGGKRRMQLELAYGDDHGRHLSYNPLQTAASREVTSTAGGFFLACEDCGGRFDDSLPACAF